MGSSEGPIGKMNLADLFPKLTTENQHATTEVIEGGDYGEVVQYMKRRVSTRRSLIR